MGAVMTSPYAWRLDPDWSGDPAADAAFGPAARGSLEPYSQWLLGHGEDFQLSNEETARDPDDFRYVAAIDDVARPRGPTRMGAETSDPPSPVAAAQLFLRFIPPSEPLFDKDAGAGGRSPGPGQFRVRVPLRRSCVRAAPARAPAWTAPPALDPDAPVVVTGVIDDGINPIHDRLRIGATGLRMDYFWVQDGKAAGRPTDRPFGREYTRAELEGALAAHPRDEDAALASLGLLDLADGAARLAFQRAHGAHVLDTAAGADRDAASANHRIVAVQLPALATSETSGAVTGYFVLQALDCILARARIIGAALGAPPPVVVNFSYGHSGGPHDGGGLVEQAIEALTRRHRDQGGGEVHVVLPTGNRQNMRGHAQVIQGAAGGDALLTLPWRIQPGDQTPNYLEIWARLPEDADLALRVRAPGGDMVAVDLHQDRPQVLTRGGADDGRGTIIARASMDRGDVPGAVPDPLRRRILLATAPTEIGAGTPRAPAPAGLWEVEVTAPLAPGGAMHAWIQRDDPPRGFRRRGRQSYFDDPAYARFDPAGRRLDVDPAPGSAPLSAVRRAGSISGLATGAAAMAIGGALGPAGAETPSPYSAAAIAADAAWPGTGGRPAGAARSDCSAVLGGILGAGARSGTRVAMNGTSVAAPQVSRDIARRLLAGEPVDPAAMFPPPAADAPCDPDREGPGRLAVAPELRFQIERDAPG